MYTDNHPELRKAVNSHLGLKTGEATKTVFEKAKAELIHTKTAIFKAIGLLNMEKYLEIVGPKSQLASPLEKDAADMLDHYFIPRPSESIDAAFARAKRESIAKLKNQAAQVKHFSYKDYCVKRKKATPARKARATNFDNVRIEKKRTT